MIAACPVCSFPMAAGPAGAGMHVSLSPYDMHNTLVAAGPAFREGLASELPSGNIDVAPTILKILKIAPAESHGRPRAVGGLATGASRRGGGGAANRPRESGA